MVECAIPHFTQWVNMEPTNFVLEQNGGPLTSVAGLTLVGKALHRFAQLPQLIDPALPVCSGIPDSGGCQAICPPRF